MTRSRTPRQAAAEAACAVLRRPGPVGPSAYDPLESAVYDAALDAAWAAARGDDDGAYLQQCARDAAHIAEMYAASESEGRS
jgi:hypothetical protein